MKFQSEIFYIGLVIVTTSILLSFLIYYSSIFSSKATEKTTFYIFDQNALSSISNFYTLRLPTFEKTYLQIAIDSMLYLRRFKGRIIRNVGKNVFYGYELGSLNSSQLVYEYFDSYFGKKWRLTLVADVNVTYGYDIKPLIVYTLPIPIPDEEVRYLVLEISK